MSHPPEPEGEPWPEILFIALTLAISLLIPACSIWQPLEGSF
jgi:hypothetical protein